MTSLGICQENAAQASISDFSSPEKNSYSLFLDESERTVSPPNWEALQLELDQKAAKKLDSIALLRVIFQKTHQRLLKNYRQHSTFSNMLDQGSYDCVSGSAALGLLLDRYGYSFDVVETDYHVFIQVYLEGKTIILESTLPVGGMITAPSAVSNYLAAYLSEGAPVARNISEGLAGIVQFNKQNYKQANDLLTKAYARYPSERIEGLKALSIDLAYHSYGIDIRK